jgi:hypothetical protein
MQRIEFSELTNRLRRNLMAAAALIIAIVYFEIKVGRAATQGLELDGLTTDVVLWILVVVLLYHGVAFAVRAIEEYRHWELTFSSTQTMTFGGGVVPVDLARKLKDTSEVLEKITANAGLVGREGQEIFTETDAKKLRSAADAALIYAKRFGNFPRITRIRFWAWDIGAASVITAGALGFASIGLMALAS